MLAYPYRGFWHPADTIKERASLEAAYASGCRPWMLWEQSCEQSPLLDLVAPGTGR
jgi:glucose-1-phosphate cytidylyltransferase